LIHFFYLNLKLICMRKMLSDARGQQHYLRPKRNDLRAVLDLRQDLKLAAESGTAHSSFNNFCDCARQPPQLLSLISVVHTNTAHLSAAPRSLFRAPSTLRASIFLSQCQPRKESMSVPSPGKHPFPAILTGLSRGVFPSHRSNMV
jgi:hypothetical protein